MEKAWVGKQWSLSGQTLKATYSIIDGLGYFDLSKFRCYDVRNVLLFDLF